MRLFKEGGELAGMLKIGKTLPSLDFEVEARQSASLVRLAQATIFAAHLSCWAPTSGPDISIRPFIDARVCILAPAPGSITIDCIFVCPIGRISSHGDNA